MFFFILCQITTKNTNHLNKTNAENRPNTTNKGQRHRPALGHQKMQGRKKTGELETALSICSTSPKGWNAALVWVVLDFCVFFF